LQEIILLRYFVVLSVNNKIPKVYQNSIIGRFCKWRYAWWPTLPGRRLVLPYILIVISAKSLKPIISLFWAIKRLYAPPLLTTSGVGIMEQMEQLLPRNAKGHLCYSHRSDIFRGGGSEPRGWLVHTRGL